MIITISLILRYKNYLIDEEKSEVTVEKYVRDIETFYKWTEGRKLTKSLVIEVSIQELLHTAVLVRIVMTSCRATKLKLDTILLKSKRIQIGLMSEYSQMRESQV